MNPHVAKLVRAFHALPDDFTPEDLERAITGTLNGVPLNEWESIADVACDQFCNERRDYITLFLAQFKGTMH